MALKLMNEVDAVKWQLAQVQHMQREQAAEAARERQNQIYSYSYSNQLYSQPIMYSAYGNSLGSLGQSGGLNSVPSFTGYAAPMYDDKPESVPAKPKADALAVMEAPEADLANGRVSLALEVEDLLGYTPLRKEVKAPSRLTRILAKLEIDVFDQAAVDGYKQQMKAHFQVKARNEDRERTKKLGVGYTSRTTVDWKMTDLSKYGKPVPEYILRKCVQIKKEVPEATFVVDELTSETRTLDPFVAVRLGDEIAYVGVYDEPEFEKTLEV